MSGAPHVRSFNVADSEARPVLVPGGNKARSLTTSRKPASKPLNKTDSTETTAIDEPKKAPSPAEDTAHSGSCFSAPSVLRRHEMLLQSNLSLNASCSSDASTDSFCSQASTGRVSRVNSTSKRRQSSARIGKVATKLNNNFSDDASIPSVELVQGKRKCAWVTSNTDPCYASFHDEEWGVPVHDDKKLFELLVLSGALAELTWPVILTKRQIFREVFLNFDPAAVAKLNEKKFIVPGNIASSLLSEPKLRATIENARQILKIINEFGSFDRYCWSFVNHKPIVNKFRYQRHVPVKTSKADVISKDLVRRGLRSVSPTVIYSFMQAAGLTNDHVVSCFRFEECIAAALSSIDKTQEGTIKISSKVEEKTSDSVAMMGEIDLELSIGMDELSIC
ncbi:probable GMP synthase [glutamine-hydrolyzing] [Zingiber officinale]|uniref:probable GMP synthase [glutamine-hydrolyzing] n=1 Tax=Zingiber officinale TaxID=94328 RepID=UPI001C4DCA4F|nr:probable GMP synthase [glutamine-hydrolyzing] [Zingiber officinale]